VTAIRSATLEQIATIPGIGTKTAQIIMAGISREAATSPTVDMATGEILDK
jgi:excinuclease ABC subunit C